jgi:S1-C subfamily serine protease
MKKSIISFLLGVVLTFFVMTYITTQAEPAQEPLPTPTPQIVYVTPKPQPTPTPQIIYKERLTDLETVVANTKNSCVMIYSYNKDGSIEQGSGWAYNGYVVTAKHVVDDAERIDIFTDDYVYGVAGGIEYTDPKLDVAVLRVGKTLPSLKLGDSDALKEGEKLVSITSPLQSKNVVEECTFAGKLQTETQDDLNISDTVIDGGSSGGAIFNYDSKIIGMVYGGHKGLSAAIPINKLKPILNKIK